jgi:peptidoglycan/LPS O-acetylase OafA/YrhL
VALAHCNTHYTGTVNWAYRLWDFPRLDATQILLRLWHTVFNGDAAVMLFFVLSGFVLGRSLESQPDSPARALLPYAVRRAFRLYPAAIAAGAVAFAIYPITIGQMLGTMFMTDVSVNGVLWTLQVELIGSTVVFAIWAANSRRLIAWLLAVYAVLWVFVPRWLMVIPAEFIMFPATFILGYCIPQMPARWWASKWVLPIGLAAFLLSDLVIGRTWRAHAGQIFGALLIVGHLQFRPARALESRACQFLGEVSYPLYLLHAMLAFVVMQRINALIPNAPLLLKVPLLALVSVPASLAASYAITKLVEKPGIRMGSALVRCLQRDKRAAQEEPVTGHQS